MQAALPSTISSIQTAKGSNGPDNLTVICNHGLQATATQNLLWSHKQLQSWCNYCLFQRGLMRTMLQNETANMSFQHQGEANAIKLFLLYHPMKQTSQQAGPGGGQRFWVGHGDTTTLPPCRETVRLCQRCHLLNPLNPLAPHLAAFPNDF